MAGQEDKTRRDGRKRLGEEGKRGGKKEEMIKKKVRREMRH